jgi:SAM-dependent methyltransferase
MLSVSIFTPTNNASYLEELYYSIKNQEYLEWLIFPNNGLSIEDIPEVILDDERTVIVTTDDPPTSNIGALKRICCSVASGSILAEVDHDDILTPTAIDKIQQAFEDPEVVFAYSDSAAFNDDARRTPRFYGSANAENMYDATYGWKYYDYEQDDFLYKAAVTPGPIPAHVSIILFAPDHVRAFRRSTYEEVGGYDASLAILDDSDLMNRLYTKGKFRHVSGCGYLYRVTGQNSWLARNSDIQNGMEIIQEKYIEQMAVYWAKDLGLRCLDLGGRFFSPEGYESVDLKDADVIANLEKVWPIEDNSVGVLRCYDVIEHLHDTIHFMKEASRVLIPGGYLFISVPSTDDGNGGIGRGAFQDPLHVKFFNINSFFYYTRENQARYIDTPVRFKSIILKNYYPSQWEIDNRIPYVKAFLINLKGGFRPHGLIEI